MSVLHRYFCALLSVVCVCLTSSTSSQDPTAHPRYCRIVSGMRALMCPEENFDDFACMVCYSFLPHPYRIPELHEDYNLRSDRSCNYAMFWKNGTMRPGEDFDFKNENSAIYDSIISEQGKEAWRQCCTAAKKCCQRTLSTPMRGSPGDGKYCPTTFDGWQCFEETKAGNIHTSVCEPHIAAKRDVPVCPQTLTRRCGEDGRWPSFGNISGTEWTNYTSCSIVQPLRTRHLTHVGAFIVSICALFPALVIFFVYKQLRLPRFTMHKHLFSSLLLNATVFIVFKFLVVLSELDVDSDARSEEQISGAACRFLYALTKYTRTTNYFWMFCEGFYLHKLIVAAFSEQKSLIMYYAIGWGLPIIPAAVYSIWRVTDSDANAVCWGQYPVEKFEWVVNAPNVVSLVINLLMLLNIIRVLVTKLKAINTNDPNKHYRKAVRATIVLVPLFGLHLFVTMYVPGNSANCTLREIYYYVLYLVDGLQGFLVALIFCYLNGEVQFQLRRSFRKWTSRFRKPDDNRRRHFTNTRVSTVTTTTTDNHGSSSRARRSSTTREPETCEDDVNNTKL